MSISMKTVMQAYGQVNHKELLHGTSNWCAAMARALAELVGQPELLAAPPAKYDDTLLPFLALMRQELHANSGKGDREGWLAMQPWECLLELYHHMGKLQKAVKDRNSEGIREYAADVANLCMMMVDVSGLLVEPASAVHCTAHVDFDPGSRVEQRLPTFTVFCREANNEGTTWIGTVEARDAEHASELGAEQCSVEWGSGGQNWSLDDIAVIGVAEGSVNILKWDDIE
jgi:hypothetical protein